MYSRPKNNRNIYKTQTDSSYSKSSRRSNLNSVCIDGNSIYTQRDISPGDLNGKHVSQSFIAINNNSRTEKGTIYLNIACVFRIEI